MRSENTEHLLGNLPTDVFAVIKVVRVGLEALVLLGRTRLTFWLTPIILLTVDGAQSALVSFPCNSALPIEVLTHKIVAKWVIPGLGLEHLVAFKSDGM